MGAGGQSAWNAGHAWDYGQSRKVGKCVPARLVVKPCLPTFRSGQSGTPHGFQKEQASECDLPSLLPLTNTVFLSSQRPLQPRIPETATPHPRVPGSVVRLDRS